MTSLVYLRRSLTALLVAVMLGAMAPGITGESGIPLPELSKGKGDRCVEDTDFMRRNHMELLLHQRDQTVHEGIRTRKYSLKECINCHAAEQTAAEEHFCVSCHRYAGVQPDCFQCHSMKPETPAVSR